MSNTNSAILQLLVNQEKIPFYLVRHMAAKEGKIFYRNPDTKKQEEVADFTVDDKRTAITFLWKGSFKRYNLKAVK